MQWAPGCAFGLGSWIRHPCAADLFYQAYAGAQTPVWLPNILFADQAKHVSAAGRDSSSVTITISCRNRTYFSPAGVERNGTPVRCRKWFGEAAFYKKTRKYKLNPITIPKDILLLFESFLPW